MQFSRRKFLKAAAIGGIIPYSISKASYFDKQDSVFQDSNHENIEEKQPTVVHASNGFLLPPALDKSKKIAITAPASPTSPGEIAPGVRFFRRLGYDIVIGDTINKTTSRYRYLSAPDEVRAEEFMSFIEDDSVGMILCGRGGYGVMRILPMLDYNKIRANPKTIIGFSDITALLLAIYNKSRMASYHGPVASASFNNYSSSNMLKILQPAAEQDPPVMECPSCDVINKGFASGKLVGGNLTIISATLGTEYEMDARDSIIFIEDISEHGYEIDRMLTQLELAGKFDHCNGIIFGQFKNINRRNHFYPNYGYTIREVIDHIISKTGKPCLLGMPFGHVSDNFTLPVGVRAELDCSEKTLKICEKTAFF